LKITGVLCCGNIVFDIAVWPVDNFDWNTTTWVETISEGIGGNGANTSWCLAKLGVPVRLISVLGSDARGDRLLEILSKARVDVSSVSRSAELPTPSTAVLIDRGGDRKFLHRPGASRELSGAAVQIPHDPAISHFHLANPFAFPVLRMEAAEVMKRAKDAGLTTSIDTGWDSKGRWIVDLGPSLPYTDLLFVNDSEARMLGSSDDLPTAVASLQALGASDVIVKTGARGCTIYTAGAIEDVPGYAVDAIDSTGAGDSFVAGFLAGLQRNWCFRESAAFANAVGALNVQKIGACAGACTFDETVAWMRSRLG
jgi:sugar/nucleoside kinase (ribokinase family)